MNHQLWSLLNLDAEALQPISDALTKGDERAAYAALHRHYTSRDSVKLYFEEKDTAELSAYVQKYCPEETELVQRTANEVVEHTFVFQFPWDMERTNVPVTFKEGIEWHHMPDHDVEWTYMLNRHRYWIALGQAYVMTQNEQYAQTWCSQLENWIDSNPVPMVPTRSNPAWRSIEAGIRCENWIKSFQYMKHSPHFTTELLVKMLVSLHEHAEYIVCDFNDWKRISNWGVIENHGLYMMSLFAPEMKQASHWHNWSTERLIETTRLQVTTEGTHWEQSPMYHNEVLHCYVSMMTLSLRNGIQVDAVIADTVHRMMKANMYWAKPNHHQPMQGDSDDNDIRDILTTGAILLQDSTLKFGAFQHIDYDSVWNFGSGGLKQYHALEIQEPEHVSFPFRQSGNYVMRSDWKEDARYMYFHCGMLGGGHGHADLLHFDLHAYGKDFLSDPGRYNYSDAEPLRRELKQCSAHNTTMVDGIEFTEYIDTWSNGRVAKPAGVVWSSSPRADYVEAGHTGYRHLQDRVDPLRRIIFIKPDYWVLVDSFECKEEHEFTQHFHFASDEIMIDPTDNSCRTLDGTGPNLCIIPVNPQQLEASLESGWISYEYNRKQTKQSLVYKCRSRGFTSIVQVLYPQPSGMNMRPVIERLPVADYQGNLVKSSAAEAIRIRFSETGMEHVVLISHERDESPQTVYLVDGVRVFGQIVLIERDGGAENITVMK